MTRRSDGEEEVALVDVASAAATSLFSPNMWVRRPSSRTPRPAPADAARPNAHAQTAAGDGGTSRAAPSELAYLEAPDREGAEKEQTEADVAHLAMIDDEIAAAEERNAELQRDLQAAAAEAEELRKQSGSMKRLFAALGVARDDFNMAGAADAEARKRRMVEIGQRLVGGMAGAPKAAAPPPRRGRPPLNPPPAVTPAPPPPGAPRPAFTPPASCPVEAQVAAAALTLSAGDPAVALLSLLEKALAAKTAARPASAAAAAPDAPPAAQAVEAAQ